MAFNSLARFQNYRNGPFGNPREKDKEGGKSIPVEVDTVGD